ncbi:uncharacterized protein LOC134980369 [Pseudophryne corroboree]|uniref:uncharacterized protein LOC134980369 n=1 Tax=Pseudophryne corroboree TaxID=495146 RepID=UPI0030812C22
MGTGGGPDLNLCHEGDLRRQQENGGWLHTHQTPGGNNMFPNNLLPQNWTNLCHSTQKTCHKPAPDWPQELGHTSGQNYYRKNRKRRMWIHSHLFPCLFFSNSIGAGSSMRKATFTSGKSLQLRQDSFRDTVNIQLEGMRRTMESMVNTLQKIQKTQQQDRHTIMDSLQILTTAVCKLVDNAACQSATMDSMAASHQQTAESLSLIATYIQLISEKLPGAPQPMPRPPPPAAQRPPLYALVSTTPW